MVAEEAAAALEGLASQEGEVDEEEPTVPEDAALLAALSGAERRLASAEVRVALIREAGAVAA